MLLAPRLQTHHGLAWLQQVGDGGIHPPHLVGQPHPGDYPPRHQGRVQGGEISPPGRIGGNISPQTVEQSGGVKKDLGGGNKSRRGDARRDSGGAMLLHEHPPAALRCAFDLHPVTPATASTPTRAVQLLSQGEGYVRPERVVGDAPALAPADDVGRDDPALGQSQGEVDECQEEGFGGGQGPLVGRVGSLLVEAVGDLVAAVGPYLEVVEPELFDDVGESGGGGERC